MDVICLNICHVSRLASVDIRKVYTCVFQQVESTGAHAFVSKIHGEVYQFAIM